MQQPRPRGDRLGDDESEPTTSRKLYGIDDPRTQDFGRKCLLARRLVERGVRFVQIYSGGNHNDHNWDAHGDLELNHNKHAGATDQPIAGLLMPTSSSAACWTRRSSSGAANSAGNPPRNTRKGTGRDHNSAGFTMWLAGGGIPGGRSIGATDELGNEAVDRPFHVKNLHATILHQLGLDPNRLSFLHAGLDQRLVGPAGAQPIRELLS